MSSPARPGAAAPRLEATTYADVAARLAAADAALARQYPGDPGTRQPVHTVYVPGDRYTADLTRDWGGQAQSVLAEHGGGAAGLAEVLGLAPDLVVEVHDRVRAKLDRQPIEDLRIDFEDGYGDRGDDAEDADVLAAAGALVASVRDGSAPPFVGIRFKSLEPATRVRGLRTLDLFLGGLLDAGDLPPGLVVTLPKVTSAEQVEAMVLVCDRLEEAYDLSAGRLGFELQIETSQAVLGADGTATVARMVHAAEGRCTGLHYGTYDYSAALGVAAAHQSMEHPVADHAKAVMLLAAAGTGVRVSDGSTNVLPVGDRAGVHAAWRLHARLVRRSLDAALYQGWDLHPAQLPTRYLATYAFFREAFPAAAARLRAYAEQAGGGTLDEPATAQALAAVVVRGLDCGALDEPEVRAATGLDRAALDGYARRRVG